MDDRHAADTAIPVGGRTYEMDDVDGRHSVFHIEMLCCICLAVSQTNDLAHDRMCDILTMNTLEDYPDLLATGSAISLIGGAFGRAIGPSLSGFVTPLFPSTALIIRWIYSMSTEFEAGTLGRQISWISMLAFGVPPMICVIFFKGPTADRSGYEGVPLNDAGRDSFDDESREPSRAKVTGADV